MTAIYQEILMSWNGREYDLTPTFRLIQSIEQDVSLFPLLGRIQDGSPPLSHCAIVLSRALRSAGCKDDDAGADPIYRELCDISESDQTQFLLSTVAKIVWAMTPQKGLLKEKKQSSPEAEKDTPTSNGQGSTSSESSDSKSDQAISGTSPSPSFG